MAKQTFTTGQVLTAAQMTSLQQTAMGGGSTTAKTTSYTLVAADAGTVIQMNSASATTITVNTALFAAGDTVQIQNIGAGVCTVTAGTATVNTAGSLALSQYEGGQLYFNTTSAALFFDTIQASGGTSALTKISTGTFTTVANTSTTFDGVFTSTYKKYMIVSNNLITSSNPLTVSLQLRAAAVTKATNYYGAIDRVGYSGTSTITGTNNGASCPLGEGNTTYAIGLTMYFTNVGNSSQKAVFYGSGTSGNDNAATSLGYYQDTADTYTGFILSVASGTISGTVTVYGLEN